MRRLLPGTRDRRKPHRRRLDRIVSPPLCPLSLDDAEFDGQSFIVDVLDTLLLTPGMEKEYARAKEYVRNDLTFDVDGKFNAFEVGPSHSFVPLMMLTWLDD